MKPSLSKVLDDLINGRIPDNKVPLSGGLWLQYRAATVSNPLNRLCCYRIGSTPPSVPEFNTIRRELETLQAIRPTLGGQFQWTGTDNQVRTCRVFSWLPVERPTQAELPIDLPDEAWKYGD
jgi:hypothetical protein